MKAKRLFSLRQLTIIGAASALFCLSAPAFAQQTTTDEGTTPTTPVVSPRPVARELILIDAPQLAILPDLLKRAGAISLQVDLSTLNNSPAARDALLDWVGKGGTVFLHTDAAQIFGYQTVTAREGNNQQAGQLYDVAHSALPFAAHPLLWDDGAVQRGAARLPGINNVFYTMRPGDQLVVSHPAGTPLLRATDLAGSSQEPLYAAALAPFGKGLAVFTPDYVDPKRGDGAAFVRNILGLLPDSTGASRWVGISQAAVDGGEATLTAELTYATAPVLTPALPAFGTTGDATAPVAAPPVPAAPANPRVDTPILLLSRGEALSALNAIQAGQGAPVLNLFRARVALLRGDYNAAQQDLNALNVAVPNTLEAALVEASLTSVGVNNFRLTSIDRAAAADNVGQLLAGASPTTLLLTTPANAQLPTNNLMGQRLQGWATSFSNYARLLATLPPLAQTVGTGDDAVTVRYFADDPNAPLVAAAATALLTSRAFGWRPDGLEILLFPSDQTYTAHRLASGLTTQNVPFPTGGLGDVAGNQILLASIPIAPVAQRLPNGQVRVLPPRTTTIQALARLYGYSLLTAYFNGTGQVPGWIPLGLENLANTAISGSPQFTDNQALDSFAQAGGLLTPQQFNNANAGTGVASAQAASMVDFFYSQYGVGAFVETVQRIAAGESVDDALTATTGENEASFFQAWRDARFGPRNFPNRG